MSVPQHPPVTHEARQHGPTAVLSSLSSLRPQALKSSASLPYLDTSVAMTLTPATGLARSSSSSARVSPLSQAIPISNYSTIVEGQTQTARSFHAYPSPSMRARSMRSDRLSERSPSPHSRINLPPSSMAEALQANKSPGALIRRMSRGASNRLRRRASTTQSMRLREQSAGPVLMRRPTETYGGPDYGQDVSDLDLDSTTDDMDETLSVKDMMHSNGINALGIHVGRRSQDSAVPFEGGEAPTDPAILVNGTRLIKCTKKRRKPIKMWIDTHSARVCWHTTNPIKSFYIDDCELRSGADSRNMREGIQVSAEEEPMLLTILYAVPERRSPRKALHLIMPSYSILKLWKDALKQVNRDRIACMNALAPISEKSERGKLALWQKAMHRSGPGSDRLSLDDARWICRTLEINCASDTVRLHFSKADPDNTGFLDIERFGGFINSFKRRKDIQHLFRNVTHGTNNDMSLADFLTFLKEDQSIDVDKDRAYWETIFDKFAKSNDNRVALPDATPVPGYKGLDVSGFQDFLGSWYNDSLVSHKSEVLLDRPLNEYFISSSHNTYLLGRQFAGASSIEGYISALIKGCRCVEIDCWDGENGQPAVTHGRTMSSKVAFEDCVSAIAKYAFHSSPYPLIVSLEVHCNPEQQGTMAEIMTKYWNGMLVTQPITNSSVLPSPEELKNKILIKVKAAEPTDQPQLFSELSAPTIRTRALSLQSSFTGASVESQSYAYSPPVLGTAATTPSDIATASTPRGSTTSGPTISPSSSADDSDGPLLTPDPTKKRKTSKIVPKLGQLGVYVQGIKFDKDVGFAAASAKSYNHIFSFAEPIFDKLCRKSTESKDLLEKHNMHYLMRVYPAALRLDSSNFNPLQAWRRGVQMAALNWQTYDVHQQVNEAMFAAGSDHLGYVLKPEELRHAKHLPIMDTVEASNKREKRGKKLVKFTVDIISAQRLPRPWNQSVEAGMNPYVEFEMYSAEDKAPGIAVGEGGTDASARDGSSGIGQPLRKRTQFVEGNGFDPCFNETINMTVQTKYPSLIFVRWTVWNRLDARKQSSKNVLLATFTAKLSSLQQGYRHLPLFNPHGEQYQDAKLFVKIRKEAPIALDIEDNAYGKAETKHSPRIEPMRSERSWPRRIFSRNPSEKRRNISHERRSQLSRTSSMDRESVS